MRSSALVLALVACGRPVELVMTEPPPPPPPALSHADGALESWQTARPVPTARANHCATAFGDFLIVAGGNYRPTGSADFVTLDDVLAAHVNADGTLAPWNVVGHLPAPAVECVLAVQGHTLVLAGAMFEDSALNARVWTATFADDATLGAWSEVGTLPYGRRALGAGAVFRGTTLWLTDARLPSEGDPEAVLAHAELSTTLGAWESTKWATTFVGKPLGAFALDAVYLMGGYREANAVVSDVTAVPLTAGAAPSASTALPEGRTSGAAVFADGYLFAFGGRTQILGVAPLPATFSAKAGEAWSTQRALPEARSNHTATAVGDYVFVVGGGNNGPGLDTVFSARVKHAPAAQ